MTFELIVLCIAAPPATLAPVLYAVTARWYRSKPGWAFMCTMLALALLIDLTLVFHAWDGHIGLKLAISKAVYVLVAAAVWLKFYALLSEQLTRRRRR